MPKLKTLSSAKKRFKVTGSGKVKHYSANHNHRLRQKSNNAKGRTRGSTLVGTADVPRAYTMLCMGSNH